MTTNYPEFVHRLCKPGEDILKSLTPAKCHLLHMAMALNSEAGELADAIKKHVIYNQPLNMPNVREELGDIEFFLQGLRNCLGISRDNIITENQFKLSQRYAALVYSDKAAEERKDKCS